VGKFPGPHVHAHPSVKPCVVIYILIFSNLIAYPIIKGSVGVAGIESFRLRPDNEVRFLGY